MRELPTEIIIDILTRLPPKPLCRFKSVAKFWKTLISSPNFIKLHLNQTLLSQNPNLIICHDSLSTAQFSDTFLRFSALDHPVKHLPGNPTVELIGTVNGIVCIADRFKKTLILFNPETRTHRLIPPVPTNIPDFNDLLLTHFNPLVHKSVDHIVAFGFGYNVGEDDYKLLRIIECYINRVQQSREVRLYSLRSDSWKNVVDDCDCYPHQQMDGVLINNCLCFAVSDENMIPMVKCFNLKDEKFSVFKMFKYEKGFENFTFVLRELGGCLCVMANYQNSDKDMMYGWRLGRSDLWVWKEGSWVRLFSVSEPRRIGSLTHIRPVVYERGEGRVLVELDGCKLGWYDWKTGKFERVKVSGVSSKETPFDTYTYVSSLVPLRSDREKVKDDETVTVKGKSVSKKAKKKDEKMERAKEKETRKEQAKGKSGVNKKISDGFLSTGFKLRL